MLGLCRVLLRDAHEAEDAVQQTFLSAYRSLLRGSEPRHPSAWLATIARNECRGRIQRRMREPLVEPEHDHPLPDPVAAAAARADLAEIWRAIGELPRRQRRVFLLREFSGLSYAELGRELGLSAPAVESLLVRARSQLRTRLRPVFRSTAAVAPLVEIRHQLARLTGDLPDPAAASSSGAARVLAVPLAAKLAAGAAAVVVAGGTVAAVERVPLRGQAETPPAEAAAAPRAASKLVLSPPRTGTAAPAPVRAHVRLRPVRTAARSTLATVRVDSVPAHLPVASGAPSGPRRSPVLAATVPPPPAAAQDPPATSAGEPPPAPAPPGTTAGTGGAESGPVSGADPVSPPAEGGATSPAADGSTAAGEDLSGGEGDPSGAVESGGDGGEQAAGESSSDSGDGGGEGHGDGESSGGSGGD